MVDGYDPVLNRIAHVNPQGFYGFGGSTPKQITTGQLLSDLNVSGRYHVPTPGIANSSGAPIGTRGLVDHQELGGGGTQAVQRYTVTGQQGNGTALPFPQEWVRHRAGGTWSAWLETTNRSFHAQGATNASGLVTFTYPVAMFANRPMLTVGLHTVDDVVLAYQIVENTNLGCAIRAGVYGTAVVGGTTVLTPFVPRLNTTVYINAFPATA